MGQGWLRPAEFWELHPREVHWLVDAKTPRQMFGEVVRHRGGHQVDARLSEDEAAECYREAFGHYPWESPDGG